MENYENEDEKEEAMQETRRLHPAALSSPALQSTWQRCLTSSGSCQRDTLIYGVRFPSLKETGMKLTQLNIWFLIFEPQRQLLLYGFVSSFSFFFFCSLFLSGRDGAAIISCFNLQNDVRTYCSFAYQQVLLFELILGIRCKAKRTLN